MDSELLKRQRACKAVLSQKRGQCRLLLHPDRSGSLRMGPVVGMLGGVWGQRDYCWHFLKYHQTVVPFQGNWSIIHTRN